jgi:hypothetical protein
MTHSNSLEKPAEPWAGEKLWNVSLLPISPGLRPRAAPEPLALIVELPLPKTTETVRRRPRAA